MIQKDTLNALVGYTATSATIQTNQYNLASAEIWIPVLVGLAAPIVVDFVIPYLRKAFKINKND